MTEPLQTPPPPAGQGRRVALLAVAVLLAACPSATLPPSSPPARMAAATIRPMVPAPPPVPRAKPPSPPVSQAPRQETTLKELQPEALVGLSQDQARHMLGSPLSHEEESSAIVWRYARSNCDLRLFFFMDVTSHDFRTLSYDMTSTGHDPNDPQRCLTHLAARTWDDSHE